MNHLTLHAYEEDGELIVYRCPECGSSGKAQSRCEAHEPPLGLSRGPKREPVRVPGVGEEPRYTLEQVRAGLLSDGAKLVAEEAHDAVYDRPENNGGAHTCELVPPSLEAALDHFTQQPASTCKYLQDLQVGEQPAGVGVIEPCRLERLRDCVLGDEAIGLALLAEGAVAEDEMRRGETTPDKSERMTRAGIEAAFDYAIEQLTPVGLGAGLQVHLPSSPPASADSDGNQQRGMEDFSEPEEPADKSPITAQRDGNQQPQGGGRPVAMKDGLPGCPHRCGQGVHSCPSHGPFGITKGGGSA